MKYINVVDGFMRDSAMRALFDAYNVTEEHRTMIETVLQVRLADFARSINKKLDKLVSELEKHDKQHACSCAKEFVRCLDVF